MPDLTVAPRDMLLTALIDDSRRFQPYIVEGRQKAREGEVLSYSVLWANFDSITSVVTKAYKNGTAVAAVLTGTELFSGTTQTCKIFTVPSGAGGSSFVIECTVVGVDNRGSNQTRKVGFTIDILRPGHG